mgnify:CR=1 FL=1
MKGDKKIIGILNSLLAGELTAVDQYLIHGEMYSDMGFGRLAEKALHESEHEREHARALIQRILFLEGLPNFQLLGKLRIGEDPCEVLGCDLALENEALASLKRASCEAPRAFRLLLMSHPILLWCGSLIGALPMFILPASHVVNQNT